MTDLQQQLAPTAKPTMGFNFHHHGGLVEMIDAVREAASDVTNPYEWGQVEYVCAAAYAATNDALRLHVRNVKLRDENRRLREACRKWNERDLEHGLCACGHARDLHDHMGCTSCGVHGCKRYTEGRFASETIRAYNETQQLIANKDRQGLAEALARDARDFSETTHKSSDAINSGIPNEPELSVSQEWLDGYRHGYAESKLDTTESLTHRGSGYHAPKINPHSLTPPTPGLNGARQTNTPRMEQ